MTSSCEKIPALSIKLYGKTLVEASAGTGKTWTLTGILLRILLENIHIAPRQISAVTFTRKATAEMRSRLQNRFDAFSYLCRKLLEIYQHKASFLSDDLFLAERILHACEELAQNTDKNLADAAADKVNIYLLEKAAKNGLNGLIALFERISLLEKELDEIFIGTLDSLAQNWLEEFAVETGYAAPDKFVEEQSAQMLEIIQNNLRKQYQESEFVENLPSEITDEIESSEYFAKEIAKKELFISSYQSDDYSADASKEQLEIKNKRREISELFKQIDEIKKSPEFLQALEQLPNIRREILEQCPTFVSNVNKSLKIYKYCTQTELNNFFEHLQTSNINLANPYFEGAIKLFSLENQNQKDALKYEKFSNSEIGQILAKVLEPYRLELEIKNKNKGLEEVVRKNKKYRNSVNAKRLLIDLQKNLSHKLEEQSVASFNSQFERLNKALDGEKGKELARYIARRYPVMLVDESQDLNNAQSDLLEKIYLQNQLSGGFFMPVGDPKQAIYRFRGGDEQNYENLKAKFKPEEISELNQSYRSSPEMVAAINEFYQFLAGIEKIQLPYQNASSAVEKAELVCAGGEKIEKTLFCTTVTTSEEYQEIARQAAYLLSEKSPYRLIDGGQMRQILPEDILILMPKNFELRAVREELQKLGIAADCPSEEYLFAGEVAKSLHFLFCAIWNPDDFANLNALLASVFFDKNEEESRLILQSWQIGDESAPEKQADIEVAKAFYTELMHTLNKAQEMWIKRKLPAALQFVLSAEIAGESIWERLAGREILESKRYLSDLRQIQEIVNSEGRVLSAAAFIRYWQRNLAAPKETGIKSEAVDAANKGAVRLLTFHKAKGLENHIVFIGGLAAKASEKQTQLLYPIRNQDGRLTISCRYPEDKSAKENRQKEENAEGERLLYVALTRARNLSFIFFRKGKKIAYKDWGEDFWAALEAGQFPHIAEFSPPPESEITLKAQTRQEKTKQLAHNPQIPSPFRKTGWRKTSFSVLNLEREEEHSSADLQDFAVEEIAIAKEENADELAAEKLIQNNFPAGARAGSFLHKALEEYGTKPLPILIAKLNRRFNLGLSEDEQKQSQDWIEKIMQSKLASGVKLKNIQSSAREMGFSLAVNRGKNLAIEQINKLLADWGKPVLLNENYRQAVGFLRGEIDLCYEHQGRFFVVDYKSNKLGIQAADYSEVRKIAEMDKHGYWLQALIYQTALHRFLAQRLPDYQPEKHLGEVEYLFLRAVGIAVASLKIEIPVEIVLGFDAVLRG